MRDNATRAQSAVSRADLWASTMRGHELATGGAVVAHPDTSVGFEADDLCDRLSREQYERNWLAKGATLACGAGERAIEEDPDPFRTCYERDRDRVLHSTAFRRLAGKTQVFIAPDDHQRTRLTHALEVSQLGAAIGRALRFNVALIEAIAMAHDCGHGPGGHPSEDLFSRYLAGGFDHAVWGADVTLEPLNLTRQVLDGVRNHSWSRPAPSTPEGEVVSLVDRCAYCTHDLEDAISSGILDAAELPAIVKSLCGTTRSGQLHAFFLDIVAASRRVGCVAMSSEMSQALAALRAFNYERIYTHEESLREGRRFETLLGALLEHFIQRPLGGDKGAVDPGSKEAAFWAVGYVGGMTDRYACRSALEHLAWPVEELPRGVGHWARP